MRRRAFLRSCGGGLVACAIGCEDAGDRDAAPEVPPDAGDGAPDAAPGDAAAPPADACTPAVVAMHDTYAQALYFDGTLGPLTGIVEVAYVLAGTAVTLDFWHGHGGELHRYTLEPAHLEALVRGERIVLGTTTVDGHAHTLFVDPLDEANRVPGAPDVEVPLGTCEEG